MYFIEINPKHLLFILFTPHSLDKFFKFIFNTQYWFEFPPSRLSISSMWPKTVVNFFILTLVYVLEAFNTFVHFFFLETCVLLSCLTLFSFGFPSIYRLPQFKLLFLPLHLFYPILSILCPRINPGPDLFVFHTKLLCKFIQFYDLTYAQMTLNCSIQPWPLPRVSYIKLPSWHLDFFDPAPYFTYILTTCFPKCSSVLSLSHLCGNCTIHSVAQTKASGVIHNSYHILLNNLVHYDPNANHHNVFSNLVVAY